jgi:RNA polymerase sigma factor (TIGR02999 family)
MAESKPDVTELLLQWGAGDTDARDRQIPLVYHELRKNAAALLARERPGHTLSATGLVHEVFLKMVNQRQVSVQNRAHFFGAAGHIMRRVLVDHAKKKYSDKRGGSVEKVAMQDDAVAVDLAEEGLLANILDLDSALAGLAELDARKAQVVEMKFFAGMTNQEIAAALQTSDATVERDWKFARAWLIQALNEQPR